MATIRTERNAGNNQIIYDYICDTMEDMAAIDLAYTMVGSTCMVLEGSEGKLAVYKMTESDGWQLVEMTDFTEHSIMSIKTHICDVSEIGAGNVPIIQEPDTNTYYFVPVQLGPHNAYKEYLFLNGAWELFGSIIDEADKAKIDALAAAAYKPVDAALTYSTESLNVPTSLAVVNYVNQQLDLAVAALNERLTDIESVIHISNNMWENEEGQPITTEQDYTIAFELI